MLKCSESSLFLFLIKAFWKVSIQFQFTRFLMHCCIWSRISVFKNRQFEYENTCVHVKALAGVYKDKLVNLLFSCVRYLLVIEVVFYRIISDVLLVSRCNQNLCRRNTKWFSVWVSLQSNAWVVHCMASVISCFAKMYLWRFLVLSFWSVGRYFLKL